MMKEFLLVVLCLWLPSTILQAQEVQKKWLYIEAGMDFISCAPPDDKEYIRGDVNPAPVYYETSYMSALFYKTYAGVKAEFRAQNGLLGLLTGLRLTRTESSLGKNDYWTSRSDFLYLLYRQQETTTEYLKVRDITQVSEYLGIPLEMRIYPYESRTIQLYYKIGFDFNVLLHSNTKTRFFDPGMDVFEKGVEDIVEDPWPVYATFHLAIGLKIGKPENPGINIEACVPQFLIANYNESLVAPEIGGGIQLNLRIPF